MKKIVFDLTYYKDFVPTTGVGSFAKSIVDGIHNIVAESNLNDVNITLLVPKHNIEAYRTNYPSFNVIGVPFNLVIYMERNKGRLGFVLRTIVFSWILRNIKPDVLWLPYATPFTDYALNTKMVYTVHDIIPLHESENNNHIWRQYDRMITIADRIITVSNHTSNDLQISLNVSKDKLYRIYNPIEEVGNCVEAIQSLKDKKFIVELNAYQDRKNKITVLKAFNLIKDDIDMDLVFCGGYVERDSLSKLTQNIVELNLEDRVHCFVNVSDAQRNWLLKKAELYVTSTLSEGFGRTPIEAAMCNTPIIVPNVDSLPEVTMHLAYYYDNPLDERQLAKMMLEVINNTPSDEQLKKIKKPLAAAYSKEKIAKEYYNQLIRE